MTIFDTIRFLQVALVTCLSKSTKGQKQGPSQQNSLQGQPMFINLFSFWLLNKILMHYNTSIINNTHSGRMNCVKKLSVKISLKNIRNQDLQKKKITIIFILKQFSFILYLLGRHLPQFLEESLMNIAQLSNLEKIWCSMIKMCMYDHPECDQVYIA